MTMEEYLRIGEAMKDKARQELVLARKMLAETDDPLKQKFLKKTIEMLQEQATKSYCD